jgi:hypothetical protein
MEEAGLRTTQFLPHLSRQKDETLGITRDRGFGIPTLLTWAYNDPTATIDQGHALFDLITQHTRFEDVHLQPRRPFLFQRASRGIQ